MKSRITALSAMFIFALISFDISAQGNVPEILYYKFDQSGTTVTNDASSPPAGTATGTIIGLTQGGAGLCGGALIGVGGSSSSNYVSTGWNTNLGTGAWTISFWIDGMPNSTTLFYQFGDAGAGSFRCFNNGVAGANNFMLRGPLTDVTCIGCAPVGVPSMTTFVYDPTLGNIKAYHNGVLNNTVAQAALNISGTGLTVGGYTSSTGLGAGQLMDEFRIYDHAIDAQEVLDTYNACLPLLMLNIDAGITDFVTPTLPTCSFTGPVSVILKNFGTDTLTSATVNWEHNSVPLTAVSWTGSLAQYETDTVVLGTTLLASGSNLLAYTTNPNMTTEVAAGGINDSSSLNLQAGLSGNFTIGGATPDYVDFASAIADLNTFGTCGPVVFDVRDGIYTEQVALSDISSMDGVNTVTFRSENNNASLVTLTYAGTGAADNYIINMNGGDHFIFEKMTLENTGTTFSRVVNFSGICDSNRFEGCNMLAVNGGNTGTNSAVIYSGSDLDNGNQFINNKIEGGSYGMYWYGASTTSNEEGTVIEGNHFLSNYFYGLRTYYQDGIVIKDNKIDGSVTYTGTRYAMYLGYLNKGPQIIGNNIRGAGTNGWSYGMYWLNGGGTPTITGKVENNMVSVGYAGNTSTSYALYMSNIGYMDINHNTLLISSGSTSSRTFYPASGGANSVKNNIFANYTAGYAIYLGNAFALAQCDYNVLYSPTGNLGYYNGNQLTLADWQNASAFDANSLDNNPMFFSSLDLHVCNDTIGNQGTPIASITMDIDGQMRSATTPDMGADEFSGLVGSFLGPDQLVCNGDSVMLQAGSPTDTILWSTGDTTAFIWVTTPGTYTVTINSVCGTGTDAIVVNQSALVYSNYVVAPNLVFCQGDSVLLYSSQMADTYQWSGGSTSTNDSVYATTGGAYTLAITDACGSGSQTVNVTMNTAPTAGFTTTSSYLSGAFNNTSSSAGATTYLWDFGDGTSSTEADPIHVFPSSGTYTVTLTVTNACGSNVFTNTITLAVAGLEEVADFGTINVYPNPSTGEFQLEMDVKNAINLDIVVTNTLGQTLLVKSMNTTNGVHTETIDLSSEAAGVYYLNISSEGNTLTNRMIIKK